MNDSLDDSLDNFAVERKNLKGIRAGDGNIRWLDASKYLLFA